MERHHEEAQPETYKFSLGLNFEATYHTTTSYAAWTIPECDPYWELKLPQMILWRKSTSQFASRATPSRFPCSRVHPWSWEAKESKTQEQWWAALLLNTSPVDPAPQAPTTTAHTHAITITTTTSTTSAIISLHYTEYTKYTTIAAHNTTHYTPTLPHCTISYHIIHYTTSYRVSCSWNPKSKKKHCRRFLH